ncbi:MAG: DUF433 domain-containing protein [Chloroflexia bacterium]
MATATKSIDIGKLISRKSGVRGGRPCIAGTGVSVMRIAGWHNQGWIPEEIASRVGLTLAQVHAALAYYYANQNEIDADIADERSAYEIYEKESQQNGLEADQ